MTNRRKELPFRRYSLAVILVLLVGFLVGVLLITVLTIGVLLIIILLIGLVILLIVIHFGFPLCLSIRNCIKRAPKSTVPGQHRFGFEKPRFCSL